MARWLRAIDDVLKAKVWHLQTGRITNSEFADWVDKQPTIEPKQDWISANDKLPEAGQSILCVGEKGGYFLVIRMRSGDIRKVKDGIGVWHGGKGWRTFTHWMVLPEPPERNGLLETGGDMNG